MLTCAIVDDEPLARNGMAEYIKEINFLELGFVSMGPVGLEGMLISNKIDLIFLDIQMPDMNGIEFLRSLQHPPMVSCPPPIVSVTIVKSLVARTE